MANPTREHSRRIILALAAITLAAALPVATQAQTRLTVVGGLNMASVTTDVEGLSPESVTRLALGASAEVSMTDRFGLHVGAAYSQKGFSVSVFGAEATSKIDYLELTALAGVPFPVAERVSVHLLAGPALAFKLSCKASASFMGESLNEDCGEDGPKAMDLGLTGGARFEIGVSEKMAVAVGALYNLGLLNMDDGDSGESIRSRVMTLQAGIVYSIG